VLIDPNFLLFGPNFYDMGSNSKDSDYAAFRKTTLLFRIQEYSRRIRYPSYASVRCSIIFLKVKRGKDLAASSGKEEVSQSLAEESVDVGRIVETEWKLLHEKAKMG
jgi:hypothetical protein